MSGAFSIGRRLGGQRGLALALAALVGVLTIASLASRSELARGAFPGVANGQIAFETGRDRTGNDQIFVVGARGENPTNISNNDETETDPSFSADGRMLAFVSDVGAKNDELWTMDANGDNRRRLTRTASDEREPVFSPDGGTIAFTSSADAGYPAIHLIDASGANERPLVAPTADSSYFSPSWSPDGTKVAYVQDSGGPSPEAHIYSVSPNGSGATKLTPTDGKHDFDPDYSPDGSRIAFASDRDGNDEIYVMNADGSNPRRLTNSAYPDSQPTWSPDGTMIAFTRKPVIDTGGEITTGAGEILIIDTNGNELRNLTRASGERSDEPGDMSPAWQPVTANADTVDPALAGTIKVAPRFEVGSRQTPTRGVVSRRGTTIGFGLSEAASVKLAVERVYPGVKRRGKGGTRCVRTRSRGVPRRKRCVATKLAGWLVRSSTGGAKRVPFSGRIGKKALRPGRYRIDAGAVDAGANPARHKTSRIFTIVRR